MPEECGDLIQGPARVDNVAGKGMSQLVRADPAAEPGPQRRAAHNPDAKPGEEHPGEATFKLTVNVPVSLHQRAAGVVRYAEMTGEPEEILSLTDLVRNALAELVTHYGKEIQRRRPVPHSEAAPPGPAVTELLANAQLAP